MMLGFDYFGTIRGTSNVVRGYAQEYTDTLTHMIPLPLNKSSDDPRCCFRHWFFFVKIEHVENDIIIKRGVILSRVSCRRNAPLLSISNMCTWAKHTVDSSRENYSTKWVQRRTIDRPSVILSWILFPFFFPPLPFFVFLFASLPFFRCIFSSPSLLFFQLSDSTTGNHPQPYGINTPGAFAFVFNIIYPVYFASLGSGDFSPEEAWVCHLLIRAFLRFFLIVLSKMYFHVFYYFFFLSRPFVMRPKAQSTQTCKFQTLPVASSHD